MLKGYVQQIRLYFFSWKLGIEAIDDYVHETVCHVSYIGVKFNISTYFHWS